MTAKQHLRKAIKLLGSQTKLADATGYAQTTISHWSRKGGVPLKAALLISSATNGKVRAADLCPPLAEYIRTHASK